jgi:hypothetical protein
VVPVVLWDDSEFAPRHDGLAWLVDAESGRSRPVWMRAALRERWQRARAAREQALAACFRRHRLSPLRISGGFDGRAVTAYFFEG